MNLIIPMAGRSSRFPGIRPKWMLTHPNGKFMAIQAIAGLNLSQIEKIFFVYLKEHENQYHFLKGFREELSKSGLLEKVEMIELAEPTLDQSDTVFQAIKQGRIKGPFIVKDSDNYFNADFPAGNFICYYDLNKAGLIKPKNKSYIMINDLGKVTNIMEKQVISPYFCVGAYGFEDADAFCNALSQLSFDGERYLSNVIFQMILEGKSFSATPATNYEDWGTLEDWNNYKRSFGTLFIDMDGVIAQHSSSHFPPYYGETEAIEENVEILKTLRRSGKFQIVITTARGEEYRNVTVDQLKRFELEYDHLIMGMQHGKRIIINDYSKSNPYKSCDAINLKRNSSELKDILRDSLGIDYEEI